MLSRAIETLERLWGKGRDSSNSTNGEVRRRNLPNNPNGSVQDDGLRGWEIVVVSDGSTDRTVDAALSEARDFSLFGPSNLRVVELEKNRGKGGAVTHGMRHVRGKYVIFADADGATAFEDVKSMVEKARSLSAKDPEGKGRAIAIGSRAHYVEENSDVVVKRSLLRNLLMYAFHLFIRLLTTRRTSQIKDTQCGFKLFTRSALPDVIPHMHSEGWIFDVEMLILGEMAGIPMEEVPVAWHEVEGSKLNVVWDSIGMAWGLLVIRLAWMMGIWRKT
jgi:dolichyl-phosphate beta-glucosyltransferase